MEKLTTCRGKITRKRFGNSQVVYDDFDDSVKLLAAP